MPVKKVLIYFTQFKRILGGSDYLPLMFIAELQKEHEVTVALDWNSDFESSSQQAGIPVDVSRLKVEYIKPKSNFMRKLDAILPFYRTWRLKKLAKNADVCISAVNVFDFGKPAHHFIYLLRNFGDNAFFDYVSHAPELHGKALFMRKLRTFLAENILRPLLGMRSTRRILADPRERTYPNSRYVDKVMRDFYGPFSGTVFSPPTLFERTIPDIPRHPLRVVCIGRLFPEKQVAEIIGIVGRARELTGLDLEVHAAGHMDPSPYVEKLKRIAAENPWVKLPGALYGKEKEEFLASGTFAIHAERDEAFGISVVEYLKAGLIPLVPDEGGTPEVVEDPALIYHTFEDAAQILARLLKDEAFREEKLRHCRERARVFSLENYMANQKRLLADILKGSES